MPTEKQIEEIWTDVLDEVLYCVPVEVRAQVLGTLLTRETDRATEQRHDPFKGLTAWQLSTLPILFLARGSATEMRAPIVPAEEDRIVWGALTRLGAGTFFN
jgi:hypothetical protein